MTRSSLNKHAEQIRPHWIEWLTGLLSTVAILAIIGWILFEAVTTADRPPELTSRVLAIEPLPSGWRVMIEVQNAGDQAAAAVAVKGALLDGAARPLEEAELTFDYIAAGSSARGGFLFINNPAIHRLQIAPSGFTEP